ncbi:MAG: hypothetical protein KF715_08620 [Candidatus Didemnitutus sp.]|nr:hypothetical protein [Candidatus Didemnitutus sp.]
MSWLIGIIDHIREAGERRNLRVAILRLLEAQGWLRRYGFHAQAAGLDEAIEHLNRELVYRLRAKARHEKGSA